MLAPVRNSITTADHGRRISKARPQPAERPGTTPARSRDEEKVPDNDHIEAFLAGYLGTDEPPPEPDGDGPIKVPEYLVYREPMDPTARRGTLLNMFA